MIKIYISSVVIWLVILNMTFVFGKEMMKNKDIDYKVYIKDKEIKGKLSFTIISFIPIIRLIFWCVMIFVVFASQDTLDKLLKKED